MKELSEGPGTRGSFKSVLTVRCRFLNLGEWCGDITEHLHWDSHKMRDFVGEYETGTRIKLRKYLVSGLIGSSTDFRS